MAEAKPSFQWPNIASEHSQPDELQLLREETKRLRELVIQLSKIAIKNAANAK